MVRKLAILAAASLVAVAALCQLAPRDAEGQGAHVLLAMTDYPRQQYSAIALDQSGGIYFGHLQHWTRVGTTPSAPAAIWSRDSDGGVLIALANGDVYQLGHPALPVGDWTLTYDSNVFGGGPTSTQQQTWGQLKARYSPSRGK